MQALSAIAIVVLGGWLYTQNATLRHHTRLLEELRVQVTAPVRSQFKAHSVESRRSGEVCESGQKGIRGG